MGEEGPAFKLVCKAGPERSSPGRRMPDGQTRQHLSTAVPEPERDFSHGDSFFVGFVWFVVTLLSDCIKQPESSSGGGCFMRRIAVLLPMDSQDIDLTTGEVCRK